MSVNEKQITCLFTRIITKLFHRQKDPNHLIQLWGAGGTCFLALYKPSLGIRAFCAPSEGSGDPLPGANLRRLLEGWQDKAVQLQRKLLGPQPQAQGEPTEAGLTCNRPPAFTFDGPMEAGEVDVARSEVRKLCETETRRDDQALIEEPPKRGLDVSESAVPDRSSAPPAPRASSGGAPAGAGGKS